MEKRKEFIAECDYCGHKNVLCQEYNDHDGKRIYCFLCSNQYLTENNRSIIRTICFCTHEILKAINKAKL